MKKKHNHLPKTGGGSGFNTFRVQYMQKQIADSMNELRVQHERDRYRADAEREEDEEDDKVGGGSIQEPGLEFGV